MIRISRSAAYPLTIVLGSLIVMLAMLAGYAAAAGHATAARGVVGVSTPLGAAQVGAPGGAGGAWVDVNAAGRCVSLHAQTWAPRTWVARTGCED